MNSKISAACVVLIVLPAFLSCMNIRKEESSNVSTPAPSPLTQEAPEQSEPFDQKEKNRYLEIFTNCARASGLEDLSRKVMKEGDMELRYWSCQSNCRGLRFSRRNKVWKVWLLAASPGKDGKYPDKEISLAGKNMDQWWETMLQAGVAELKDCDWYIPAIDSHFHLVEMKTASIHKMNFYHFSQKKCPEYLRFEKMLDLMDVF